MKGRLEFTVCLVRAQLRLDCSVLRLDFAEQVFVDRVWRRAPIFGVDLSELACLFTNQRRHRWVNLLWRPCMFVLAPTCDVPAHILVNFDVSLLFRVKPELGLKSDSLRFLLRLGRIDCIVGTLQAQLHLRHRFHDLAQLFPLKVHILLFFLGKLSLVVSS